MANVINKIKNFLFRKCITDVIVEMFDGSGNSNNQEFENAIKDIENEYADSKKNIDVSRPKTIVQLDDIDDFDNDSLKQMYDEITTNAALTAACAAACAASC